MKVLDALPATEGRVRVRALEYRDAAAFARGSGDESVKRHGHLPFPEYTEDIVREQIDGAIARGLADGSLAVLAIAGDALRIAGRLAAHLGLDLLDARTTPENEASRRTLLSAGYQQAGGPQTVTTPSGAVVTAVTFERSVTGGE